MSTMPVRAARNSGSPFALWIRTGRWLPEQLDDPALEVKFNPNHDPKDGRFTFANGAGGVANMSRPPRVVNRRQSGDGTWAGGGFTGGGGGKSGGGGATGHGYWMNPAEVHAFHQRHPKLDPHMVSPGETLDQIAAARHVTAAKLRELNSLSPGATIKPGQVLALPKGGSMGGNELKPIAKNGYGFGIDSAGRTREAKRDLRLADTTERSKTNQKRAGGTDRRASDDGGHFIAVRFGGPRDSFNHFAQDANFNRGRYRTLEDGWAKQLRAGLRVSVDIVSHYAGTSRRPDRLTVKWTVNGRPQSENFSNEPKGTKHGR